MPKQDSRVRQPASMLAFMLKAWTYLIRIAAPVLLTAFLVFPESSWACRPRLRSIEEYRFSDAQPTAVFIGTVVDIRQIGSSSEATWLISLKVERDFLKGRPEEVLVVRSHQREHVDPMLAGCMLPKYLAAGMGERWLVVGKREVGFVIPDSRWSQRVPATGLDVALLKRLSALSDTGDTQMTEH